MLLVRLAGVHRNLQKNTENAHALSPFKAILGFLTLFLKVLLRKRIGEDRDNGCLAGVLNNAQKLPLLRGMQAISCKYR